MEIKQFIILAYAMVLFILAVEWVSIVKFAGMKLDLSGVYSLLKWVTVFFAGFGLAILLL